ncbi:acyl-ACP desaturase [Nocardia tengchongensis]|uniref:acyl-ACP desaturase n=1 Tax=Nocardia tengchongensis TaxID=2055889 RepID=UPI0036C3FBF5
MEFFELAERKRRWSVFDDIPWEKWEERFADPVLATCAETFLGVEMYLPDYVAEGLNLTRDSFGQAWFHVNWGYEESKHGLALREYLVRTGQRSEEQMRDYERTILSKSWELPFRTPRRMFVYGALQEKVTWMSYRGQRERAIAVGDPVMTEICRLIARDEAAHSDFYQKALIACIQEDEPGTLRDILHVLENFRMPGEELLPDYETRTQVAMGTGVSRETFFRDVLAPLFKKIGITRKDLIRARHATVEQRSTTVGSESR